MDHAIYSLQPFMEYEIDCVREEWHSKKYKKLSDCPTYHAAKAIVDAVHRMEKYYYGKNQTLSVREQIMW